MADFILTILIYPIIIYAKYIIYNGQSRFLWLAVLVGLVFAVACRQSLRTLFSDRSVWWSDSAKIDYQIAALTPLCVSMFVLYVFSASDAIEASAQSVGAMLRPYMAVKTSVAGQVWIGVTLTIILFIVGDFRHWFQHYIFHKVPALWALHKVHHSAEVLNFVTAERFHPLESLIGGVIQACFVGVVNLVFFACFPESIGMVSIMGANAIYFALNIVGGTLRHSPIYFSYGKFWEKYLISPAMHQIHHSDDPRHFDKNFGGALSIWDRAFGTVAYAHNDTIDSVGIGEESAAYHSLWGAYIRPLIEFTQLVWPLPAIRHAEAKGLKAEKY